MKKRIMSLILLFLITAKSFATFIVIIVRPQSIMIGADSRVTYSKGIGTVNKIERCGKVWAVCAGLVSVADNEVKLDAYKVIKLVMQKHSSYDELARNDLKQSLLSEYYRTWNSLKNSDFFKKKHKRQNAVVVNVIITGMYNNVPFAHSMTFTAPNIDKVKSLVLTEDKFRTNINSVFFVGKQVEAGQYWDAHNDEIAKLNDVELINKFMDVSMQYNSDVGKPVKILSIINGNAKFIQ